MKTDTVKSDVPSEFPFVVTDGDCRVKIFRVKGAKNASGCCYQVADKTKNTDADGNFVRKLVSFADFSKAEAYAKSVAKIMSQGQKTTLQSRGPEWAEYGMAIQLLKPVQTPLLVAATRYAEAVKILGDGQKLVEAAKFYVDRHRVLNPAMKVSELVDEMIAVKMSRNKSDRYVQDLLGRLGKFKADFTGVLVDVDAAKIQQWLDGRKLEGGKNMSAQSYNNYRSVIHGLFAFAEARGYIAKGTNPAESVERQTVRGRSVAIFTPVEFASLLNAASRDFLPCLAIGGFAGLRSAEIQRLKWSDIDLQRRCITVSPENSKTGSLRVIKGFCDALAAWLGTYSNSTGLIWKGDENDFVNEQRRTARDAGMKWKGNALRHSYASYRLSITENHATVAYEMGNSPAVVNRHYKELVKNPADATAWFAILPTKPENVTQMPVAVSA